MRVACLALHTDDVNDVSFLILPRERTNDFLPRIVLAEGFAHGTTGVFSFNASQRISVEKSQLSRKEFQDCRTALLWMEHTTSSCRFSRLCLDFFLIRDLSLSLSSDTTPMHCHFILYPPWIRISGEF